MLFQYCFDVDVINRVDIVEKMLLQGRNDIDTTISKRVLASSSIQSQINIEPSMSCLKTVKKKDKKTFLCFLRKSVILFFFLIKIEKYYIKSIHKTFKNYIVTLC